VLYLHPTSWSIEHRIKKTACVACANWVKCEQDYMTVLIVKMTLTIEVPNCEKNKIIRFKLISNDKVYSNSKCNVSPHLNRPKNYIITSPKKSHLSRAFQKYQKAREICSFNFAEFFYHKIIQYSVTLAP